MSKPYQWVPSLYFYQSLPFVVVSLIASLVYQQSGLSNAAVALISSLFVVPWAIKPAFAPMLEYLLNKKTIAVWSQGLVALILMMIGLSVTHTYFMTISVIAFGLVACLSSIHDIVSDGVYLSHLNEKHQQNYVSVRTIFYQLGRIFLKAGLLVVVGNLAHKLGLNAWQLFFFVLSFVCLLISFYHHITIPTTPTKGHEKKESYRKIIHRLGKEPALIQGIILICIFNITDAQLQKILPLYLADERGGHLSIAEVGLIFGGLGGLALMTGVFLSKFIIRRFSIHQCLLAMTLIMLIQPLCLMLSALAHTSGIYVTMIVIQLISGLVNGVFMAYMLLVASQTAYPMTAYTICTSVMALSISFYGAFSGYISDSLGYFNFFIYLFCLNILLIGVCVMRGKSYV